MPGHTCACAAQYVHPRRVSRQQAIGFRALRFGTQRSRHPSARHTVRERSNLLLNGAKIRSAFVQRIILPCKERRGRTWF